MRSLSAFNFVLNKAREIYGLNVIVEHLDTKYASHCIPALKCLIINSNCNQDALPMIAGHELGHYVNGDEPRSSIATFSYTANEEAEADKFGIGLLTSMQKTKIWFSILHKILVKHSRFQKIVSYKLTNWQKITEMFFTRFRCFYLTKIFVLCYSRARVIYLYI